MNYKEISTKFGVAALTSLGVAEGVSATPLLTALITFGVSIITVVGGEAIKLAVAWFKKKQKDLGVDVRTKKKTKKDKPKAQ